MFIATYEDVFGHRASKPFDTRQEAENWLYPRVWNDSTKRTNIKEIKSEDKKIMEPTEKLHYVKVDIYLYADSEGSAEDKAIQMLDKACENGLVHSYDVCGRGTTK